MIQIIRLKDGLEKDTENFNRHLAKNETAEALSFAQKILESIQAEFTDILAYYGVTPYKVEGNKFNPLKQTAVKPIYTTDQSLFKIVAQSLSYGYERNGRIISKERVAAYAIEKPTEQEV
jgi:molecular chaperone GrpE (heat shock protein)